MTKRQLHDRLFRGFDPLLRPQGFRLKKSEEGFVRMIPGGKQFIGFAITDWSPGFKVYTVFSSRSDEVEALYHKFSGTHPTSQKLSYSLMGMLDDILPEATGPIIVTDERSVDEFVSTVTPIVVSRVLPFLDSHKSIEELEREANSSSKVAMRMSHPGRAMTGIALAYLTGKPDLDELIVQYREEMTRLIDMEKEKFERLVEFLRSHREPKRSN